MLNIIVLFTFVSFTVVSGTTTNGHIEVILQDYVIVSRDGMDTEGNKCGLNCTVVMTVCMAMLSPNLVNKEDADQKREAICHGDTSSVFRGKHHSKTNITHQHGKGYIATFDRFDRYKYAQHDRARSTKRFYIWIAYNHVTYPFKKDAESEYDKTVQKYTLVEESSISLSMDELELNAKQRHMVLRGSLNAANHGSKIVQESFMVFGLLAYCQPMYFGCGCEKFCADSHHYTCHARTGDKVCNGNYYGENCDKHCRAYAYNHEMCREDGEMSCEPGYQRDHDNKKCDKLDCNLVKCTGGKTCRNTKELRQAADDMSNPTSKNAQVYARCVT